MIAPALDLADVSKEYGGLRPLRIQRLTVSAPGFLNGLVALANATTNAFPMIQISGSSDRAQNSRT